jgi:L-lactate utilization protein LutB
MSFTTTVSRYHDALAAAMRPFQGQELTTAEIIAALVEDVQAWSILQTTAETTRMRALASVPKLIVLFSRKWNAAGIAFFEAADAVGSYVVLKRKKGEWVVVSRKRLWVA